MTLRYLHAAFAIPLVFLPVGSAADWPQFRGPHRDGISSETGLLKSWTRDGPPLVWQAKGLGGGYSSVSIAGDKIYTLGNKGRESHVMALDRESGKVLWSTE